jgi:hypothetical protein
VGGRNRVKRLEREECRESESPARIGNRPKVVPFLHLHGHHLLFCS